MMFKEALLAAAAEFGLVFAEGQLQAYDVYYRMLAEWNDKMNLTALVEPGEVAVKHVIDSLSCYDEQIFQPGSTLIDVGSGAGFPGLPLKIWQDDLKITLLDSLHKRLGFLRAVAERLALPEVQLVHSRAEDGGRNPLYREKYDIAVARAVAKLSVLCELCLPFVRTGGYFVALKGARYREEVEEARRALQLLGGEVTKVKTVKLPDLADQRAIVYIRKNKNMASLYPRRAGLPEKKPL